MLLGAVSGPLGPVYMTRKEGSSFSEMWGSGLNQNDLDFLADAVPLLALEPPQVGDSSFIRFRPHLVAEWECLELTEQLRLRHPVFKRFRFDKRAEECRLEDDGP